MVDSQTFERYYRALCIKLGVPVDPKREAQMRAWFKQLGPEIGEGELIAVFRRLENTDLAFPRFKHFTEAVGSTRKAKPHVTTDCLYCEGSGLVSVYPHPAGFYYGHEAHEFEGYHFLNGESWSCCCLAGERYPFRPFHPNLMAPDADPDRGPVVDPEEVRRILRVSVEDIPF